MIILPLLVLAIIVYIYFPWFVHFGTLSSGDWPYLFIENIKEFSFVPNPDFLWLGFYHQLTSKIFVQYMGLPWEMVEKIFWFWPFVIISVASSYYLTRSWIGVILFTTNTYILMVVGGGQMGVALAYSMAPLVLKLFIDLAGNLTQQTQNFQFSIFNFQKPIRIGLVLAIQVMFDPRIAYITTIAVVLYMLFHYLFNRNNLSSIIYHLSSIIFIALILNFYWIMPVLRHGLPQRVNGLGNLASLEFLSFADFSHSLSLLHPNWPENIFGKVYFLQPEFLVLPILAYLSLLFLKSKIQSKNQKLDDNSTIVFFALLGLIGVFLAKGVNPPFGQINEWLFSYFPGMGMFRDTTKFYLLIVLSYSVLIPFSLKEAEERILSIKHVKVLSILFLLFWLFTVSWAVGGQLGGTFKPRSVPIDYIELKKFFISEPQFFKTLWIPQRQRFGFYSDTHPAISAQDYFDISDPVGLVQAVLDEKNQKRLKQAQIKYIIVPYDSQEELFIEDRKYSTSLQQSVEEKLKRGQKLRKLPSIGRISVYELQ